MVRLKSFLGVLVVAHAAIDAGEGLGYLSTRLSFMNIEFLQTIREKLQDKERQLKKEIEDLTGQSSTNGGGYQLTPPDYGSDEDENSAEVATFTTDLSVKEVLESSLRDVRSALARLDSGTYGICKYCGQPIDERRLLARPASSSCVNCKETIKNRV